MAITFTHFDELVGARKSLHGGNRGAPNVMDDGVREGDALNRACVLMLSASLQTFVEDCFLVCSQRLFQKQLNSDEIKKYKSTWSRWGNPNPANIEMLFRRIGVIGILDGLSWQKQTTDSLKRNLDTLNQVRNCVAHGTDILVNNAPYTLRLSQVTRWRNVCLQFGNRFEAHALAKL